MSRPRGCSATTRARWTFRSASGKHAMNGPKGLSCHIGAKRRTPWQDGVEVLLRDVRGGLHHLRRDLATRRGTWPRAPEESLRATKPDRKPGVVRLFCVPAWDAGAFRTA